MQFIQLLGSGLGLAFLSGINLYAAVLTVGLGTRFGIFELPEHLQGLSVLSEPYILIIAAFLYLVEFLADKIPWVDSIWDSIHTFIRPVGAAIIGIAAIGHIDPALEVIAFLIFGGVGLTSHSSKASTRALINQSPEPASNIAVSVIEDMIVVVGAWIAITNPIITFVIVVILLVIIMFFFPKIFRLVRLEVSALIALILTIAKKIKLFKKETLSRSLPDKYSRHIPKEYGQSDSDIILPCYSGKGVKIGRNCKGYMLLINNNLLVLLNKMFRIHNHKINFDNLCNCEFRQGLLLDNLYIKVNEKTEQFKILKGQTHYIEEIVSYLKINSKSINSSISEINQ